MLEIIWRTVTPKIARDFVYPYLLRFYFTAVDNCKKYGLEFDAINKDVEDAAKSWINKHPTSSCSNKVTADVYIDDRSYDRVGRNIDWYQVKNLILQHKE